MSCPERSYGRGALIGKRGLGPGLTILEATWEGPAPLPGQFFMLKPERSAHFLGRPLSVLSWEGGKLGFLVAERGEGTRELCALRAGEGLFLSGPLGRPWPQPAPPRIAGTRPALVAGGVGIAPLAFLASSLEPGSYDLYAGFRDSPVCVEGFADPAFGPARLFLSSEAGRLAPRGRILDRFEPEAASELFVCGPRGLLAAAASLAEGAQLKAWLSLERRMACGVGACLGCTVRTSRGNRRACADGPVFPAEELIFDGN